MTTSRLWAIIPGTSTPESKTGPYSGAYPVVGHVNMGRGPRGRWPLVEATAEALAEDIDLEGFLDVEDAGSLDRLPRSRVGVPTYPGVLNGAPRWICSAPTFTIVTSETRP
jgi:hypothetical protein